jgi:hypothetical protein
MKASNLIQKCVIAAGLAVAAGTAAADTVYSSGSFTNPTAVNQGAAVAGASGWYFNNVRNGGREAVDTTHPRSGTASVSMSGPANAKADLEFLPNAVNVGGNYESGGALGRLAGLSAMSYDWYRDSSSTATAGQHPSMRVLIDTDGNLATTTDRGGLVFESVYNTPNMTVDAWVSSSISDATFLWNFGTPLGFGADINGNGYSYDATLADWKAFFPNAAIIGFSSGIGSGWQGFSGAVDNLSWTIDGVTTSTNFEVAAAGDVPEPASVALLALGAFGLRAARRRNRST